MKTCLIALLIIITSYSLKAQVGIGTTTPNSTLDVRGSFSTPITTFTSATTAGASDNMLVFTGSSATTLTLPTAASIAGRIYWIKNGGTATLTVATTSSQTIDALSSWSLTQGKTLRVVSDGANWYVASETYPGSTATSGWVYDGNSVGSVRTLGTITNYALPFITNNTERMRITATGTVGIGTSTFNATYPEKFFVDAGSTGNTNFQNVIVAKGNTNSYAQINILNTYAGSNASADVIATADNGTESVNYVDMGINSSVNTANYFGGLNDAYLYSIGNGVNTGGNLYIGTSTASRDVAFLTGGGTKSSGTTMNNERMRILGTGNVGIGTNTPTSTLDVEGSVSRSITNTTSNLTLDATNHTVIISSGSPTITLPTANSTNEGRIYIIVNNTGTARTISSYQALGGAGSTTIAANSSITIQAYNNNWWRIQ